MGMQYYKIRVIGLNDSTKKKHGQYFRIDVGKSSLAIKQKG